MITIYNNNIKKKNIIFSLRKKENIIIKGVNGIGKSLILYKILNKKYLLLNKRYFYWNKSNINKKKNYHNLNTVDYVFYSLKNYRKNKSIINNIYSNGMEEILKKKINKLSSGQKKYVLFMKMIFSESNIWVLDEPNNFLDDLKITFFNQKSSDHINNNGILLYTFNNINNRKISKNKYNLYLK